MKPVYSLFYSLSLAVTFQAALARASGETVRLALLDDEVAIRVPVTLFGEPTHYFLVDTGSPFSIIDASYRNRLLPLETPVSTGASTPLTDSPLRYRCPDLFVGGIRVNLPAIGCADLRMLKLISGEPCDGILGLDFLRDYVISMDFDRGILTLGSRVPVEAMAGAARAALVPMARNHIGTTVLLNQTLRIPIVIDTGNTSSLCLSTTTWDRIASPQTSTSRGLTSTVGLATAESPSLRLAHMQLGSETYTNLLALRWPREGVGSDLLGLAFLRRHVVTIDFPNSLLYLRPGKHFGEADEADMSGLHLLREGERTFVYAVNENSPAAEAGINPGDTLVKLNGKSVAGLKMRDIRRQLKARDGARATLELRRDQEQFLVSFRLKKFL